MAKIFAARRAKEITNALANKTFEFCYDDDGVYGDKESCYIKFQPDDGIYKGQMHLIKLKFDYGNGTYMFPKDPPNVIFMTPIYHVNISTSGSVCLDTIKEKWSAQFGIEVVFNSILLLLEDGNTGSPFNSDAAKDFKNLSKSDYSKITMNYYLANLKKNPKVLELLDIPELAQKKIYI